MSEQIEIVWRGDPAAANAYQQHVKNMGYVTERRAALDSVLSDEEMERIWKSHWPDTKAACREVERAAVMADRVARHASPSEDESRAAFERWFTDGKPERQYLIERRVDGRYAQDNADSSWRTWQYLEAIATPAAESRATFERWVLTHYGVVAGSLKNGDPLYGIVEAARDGWAARERTLVRPVEQFCDVCKGSGEVGGYRGGNGESGGGYETHDCPYCGGTGEPLSEGEIMVMRCDANAGRTLHASLCRRFSYHHDGVYWYRDLVSLEEHIAKQIARPVGAVREWHRITASFIAYHPDWFRGRFFLWDGEELTIGRYEWRPGHQPDRLIFDGGDMWALDGNFYAAEIIPPNAGRPAADRVAVPRELVRFLLGETEMHGAGIGDIPAGKRGRFWWRKELRDLLAGDA